MQAASLSLELGIVVVKRITDHLGVTSGARESRRRAAVGRQQSRQRNGDAVYRMLPDPKAAEVGCVRVIDESGEDYLYPEDRFITVDFPKNVRARLLAVPAK